MGKPIGNTSRPEDAQWDMVFTRLSRLFVSQVEICVKDLSPAFRSAGLWGDLRVRQTPRGLSAFFAVADDSGLLFILDFTLVDGMAVSRHTGATVDVRLLDADGDVLARCPLVGPGASQVYHASFDQLLEADGDCLQLGTVHAMVRTCFDVSEARLRA